MIISRLVLYRRVLVVTVALVMSAVALLAVPSFLVPQNAKSAGKANRPDPKSDLAVRKSNGRGDIADRYIGAVNGTAFILDTSGGEVSRTELKTSRPVFKAFGMTSDGASLLYTELRNDRPTGELYLENMATHERARLTMHVVLSASISPMDPNKIAYTYTTGDGFALAVLDLASGTDDRLVQKDVFADLISWEESGQSVKYFDTTAEGADLVFAADDTVEDPFSTYTFAASPDASYIGGERNPEAVLRMIPKMASLSKDPDRVSVLTRQSPGFLK